MKKDLHFETFETCREAEDFVRDHLTYKNGKSKDHLIDESGYWKCWLVWWHGRLVKA